VTATSNFNCILGTSVRTNIILSKE